MLLLLIGCLSVRTVLLFRSNNPEKIEQAISLQAAKVTRLESRLGADAPKTMSARWIYASMLLSTRPKESYQQFKQFYGCVQTPLCTNIPLEETQYVAELFDDAAEYELAHPFYESAVIISTKKYGFENPETQFCRQQVATNFAKLSDFDAAEALWLDIISILEKNPNNIELITIIRRNLAQLYLTLGDNQKSLKNLTRVLQNMDSLEADDVEYSNVFSRLEVMNQLCLELNQGGFFEKADAMCNRLVEGTKSYYGPKSREVILAINSQSFALQVRGAVPLAIDGYHKAIDIAKQAEKDDLVLLNTLEHNLATALHELDRLDEAEELLRRTIQRSQEQDYFDEQRDPSPLNLARVLKDKGRFEEAESLLVAYLAMLENEDEEGTPDILIARGYLGEIYHATGRIKEAQAIYNNVKAGFESLNGLQNPYGQISLEHLLRTALALKEPQRAIVIAKQLQAVEEHLLFTNLGGTEHVITAFTRSFQKSTDMILSNHIDFHDSPEAATLGFETILSRKGIVQERQASVLSQLRSSTEQDLINLFQTLQQLRKKESFYLGRQKEINSSRLEKRLGIIRKEILGIERKLSEHNFLLTQKTKTTVNDIQKNLPPQSALLEFFIYSPYNAEKDEHLPPHLGAYVLHADGRLKGKNLGAIASYEKRLQAFRQTRAQPLQIWLYKHLVLSLIENPEALSHLFIAPDGPLNLIPFDALRNPQGTLLLDITPISYLSTGRDLTKTDTLNSNLSPPIVIANPNYGEGEPWAPLPGTQNEADIIQKLFSKATIYTQESATVDVLRNLNRPEFLHIATHGFALPDNPQSSVDNNPMTRSGLKFAGANDPARPNTQLLASEAVGLNLDGTKLVVLSACESGLGEAANGEGVYGMRRALTLAGAKSQVVSLWAVSDEATAIFMKGFYERIKKGKKPVVAIRETKQEMKNSTKWSNPVFWAPFVLTGEWR